MYLYKRQHHETRPLCTSCIYFIIHITAPRGVEHKARSIRCWLWSRTLFLVIMQSNPSPIACDVLPSTHSGAMQRRQPERITSGERVSLINVRTSFDGSQGYLPRSRTLLCAFVVVLFSMNNVVAGLVPLKSSVQSKLSTSDTTEEQFSSLPMRRNLQSAPTPSPSTELWRLHINAGGSENYTDANGTAWIADSVYGVEGQRYRPSACPSSMTSTADATIYCSQRAFSSSQSNPPFVYRIPVPKASQYEVRLHFAEIVSDCADTSP